MRVAQRLRAGTVWINAYRVVGPNVPVRRLRRERHRARERARRAARVHRDALDLDRDVGRDARPVHARLTTAPGAGGDEYANDAVDVAYQAIRRAIIDGAYPAGSRLSEEELSERIGVEPDADPRRPSASSSTSGHVELRPRRGAWVSSWTAEDIAEVYGVRAQLESYGARIAADKIGALDLRHLEECCLRMEAVEQSRPGGFLDELGELNNDFHASLLRATGNRRLMTSLASIVETPLILRVYHSYDERRRYEALRHHREILAALSERDGEWAQAAMRVHILSGRHVLLRSSAAPAAGPQSLNRVVHRGLRLRQDARAGVRRAVAFAGRCRVSWKRAAARSAREESDHDV